MRWSSVLRHGPCAVLAVAATYSLSAAHIQPAYAGEAGSAADLATLSIEELGNIQVTSVSKKAEPLSDAAASVYVITHDEIMRSGATSIPEMLRLAPNVQVAQINAKSYAITARGFNGSASDKLLVLIDGRSVYTPFANGVFWDLQQVLPDDVERIEVISGPGATLWGANAVNGVINIITRKSSDTQGGTIDIGAGNLEQRGSLQYGGKLTDALSYRAYASGFHYTSSTTSTGTSADDHWYKPQGGFRFDWSQASDVVTLQGDFYQGSEASPDSSDEDVAGQNVIARWDHKFSGGSSLQVQAYYDHIGLTIPNDLAESLRTFDFAAQHTFSWGSGQQFVWGGGYRIQQDSFSIVPAALDQFFDPQRRALNYGNFFLQDSISILKSLTLILGTKVEDDPYIGAELLPSARLSWKVADKDLIWSAVSRAIRAPSRLDRDFYQTEGPLTLLQGGDFQAEKLIAYELGYRTEPVPGASLSISTYYNQYQDLRNAEVTAGGFPPIPIPTSGVPGGGYPLMFGNGMEGNTEGIEAWGKYQLTNWWRLDAGINWLHKNLRFKPGASTIGGIAIAGDDPSSQFSLRSSMNLDKAVTADFDLRRIGSMPSPYTPAYTELDARLGWAVSDGLEISLRGLNLLHDHHLEFGTTSDVASGVEIARSVYVDLRWRY